MAEASYRFEPDYAASPGEILEEYLEVRGISLGEFAQLCGRPPELIAGIISEEIPVDAATAEEFERTLGLAAHIWLGIEAVYRSHRKRAKARQETTA